MATLIDVGGVTINSVGSATWTDPTRAINFVDFADVEVQFVGTPSVAYTPVRSLDGANFVTCNAYDKDGNALTSISSAGIYRFVGGAFIKFSAGSSSTLTIRGGD